MTAYTFPQLINFTRTSAATYVNSAGLVTLTPASTNLLTVTENFEYASWGKTNVNVYQVDPSTATYGPDLIVNGDFASATGWTANAGWAIGSGVATATATSTSLFGGQMTAITGRIYRVDFDIVSYSSGTLVVTIGANYASGQGVFTTVTPGRYTAYVEAGLVTTRGVEFYGGAVTAVIDNVSVREVIGGFITAPDGTPSADIMVSLPNNTSHNMQQTTTSFGSPVTLSIYAKAGTSSFLQLSHASATNLFVNFNVATGAIGTTGGPVSASVTNAGGGWYRCSMTFVPVSAANIRVSMVTSASAGLNEIWAATGNETLYLWGAQLEQTPTANLTLGSELITNGNFSAGSTGWTLDTGITVSGNQLVCATASNQHLRQSIASVSPKLYRVNMTIISYVSGSPFVTIGAGTQVYIPSPSVVGVKTFYAVAGSSDTLFRFYPGEFGIGGTITVDDISVQEVTGAVGTPTTYTRNFGGLFPPRFDYDPVTLAPRGLLNEEQRTNFEWSQDLDNAFWTKSGASVAVNTTTAPDGTTTADKLVENTATSTHFAARFPTIAAATSYSFSVYIKAAGRTFTRVLVGDTAGANGVYVDANLVTGATATGTNGTGWTLISASATAAGNGWYRITVSGTNATATTGGIALIYPSSASGVINYLGDGVSGLFVWGAQFETGAFATSYIPTSASQVTRSADVATISYPYFAQWFNQNEGTFVISFQTIQTGVVTFTGYALGLDNSTSKRLVYIGAGADVAASFDGTTVLSSGVDTTGMLAKVASAYTLSGRAITANGNAVATGTVVSGYSAAGLLNIGQISGSTNLSGHIQSIRYYPTRLTNAQLQALTI